MHKQQTCVAYKWAYSLCRRLCLRSDVISKKMREPSLYCDEEPYNIEFCANLCHCSLWHSSAYRAKTHERMLRHRTFCRDCCTAVWLLYAWRFCALGTGQNICVNQSGSQTK